MRRQDAFSLIELLVVILIIGILATVAIPRFVGQRDSAQNAAAKSALRSAVQAAYTWETTANLSGRWEAADGSRLSTGTLREIEPSLFSGKSPCEPYSADATGDCAGASAGCAAPAFDGADVPGPNADPTRIYIGIETGQCNNPKNSVAVLCSVSKGDSIFCAALDLANGITRWRRYQTTNWLMQIDGSTIGGPTYSPTGTGPMDINQTEL